MSDRPDPEPDAEPDAGAEDAEEQDRAEALAKAERKRRLDEVFGSGEHHGGGKGDAWYRDQTPPHHG